MFPENFKIPGLSGPDFKNRKAFLKIKEYHRKKQRVNSSEEKNYKPNKSNQYPSNKYEVKKTDRIINLTIKLPIFLIIVFVSIAILKNFINHYFTIIDNSDKQLITAVKKRKKEEKKDAYNLLTRSGNYYLSSNKLDEAQSEFTRALNVHKYGKSARIGLTKTLIQKCKQKQILCEEIQPNLNFIKEMNFLSDDEIVALSKD